MRRFVGSLTASLFVGTFLATGALAQAADDQTADVAEADEVPSDVIIVTATRRAQDVQDIPLAVTAVGAAQLQAQGVDDVTEITQVAPSFSSSSAQLASGSVVLRIRGVGTTSNNIGFESAVGVFIDGAYQSRPGVALGEFVDIERVEVLRGPQGTLFGRNTSAGALNITTKRPDLDEFTGFANATYGNRDLFSVQGGVNVPLVDDALALRLTGAYRQRDGYIDLLGPDGNSIGESNGADQYLLRGQLGFESAGGIRGRLIADYSRAKAPFGAAIEVQASPLEFNGIYQAVGFSARAGMVTPVPATNPFDVTGAQAAVDRRQSSVNFEPLTDIENWGVVADLEFPIGDAMDLFYVGSFRKFDASEAFDSDFTTLDGFSITGNETDIETMSHELRLQGEAFDGKLNWLIGGFYSDEKIDQALSSRLGSDWGRYIGAVTAALTGGASLNPASPLFLGPRPLTTLSGGLDPAGTTNTNLYAQDSESWSLFTHNVLSITDRLELTLGLRWSDESKQGSFAQTGNTDAVCPTLAGAVQAGLIPAPAVPLAIGLGCFAFTAPADLPQAAFLPVPRTFDEPFDDEELIYTAKLGYEFGDGIHTYASFTHGYKSGGFNLDATAALLGADPSFRSELVDAYEIGVKTRLLDNAVTLNMAAFHEEFTDFQVLEFTGSAFQTFNVPEAKTTGFELESVIRPSDGWSVNLGFTYTDARYPEDCAGDQTAVEVIALCGNSLTNAPEIVAIAGFNYDRDLSATLRTFVSGQIRMSSDERTSTQAVVLPNAAQIAAAGSVEAAVDAAPPLPFDIQDGTAKINLRAGIGSVDERWTLEVWGTNITNEITRGVTFNTVARPGSRSAFIQEPRSYGVTVRTRY